MFVVRYSPPCLVSTRLFFFLKVDVGHVDHSYALRPPLGVELVRSRGKHILPVSVITHQRDIAKAGRDRARRDVPNNPVQRLARQRDRSGKTHMAGFPDWVAS